jgi:hypothetical protein
MVANDVRFAEDGQGLRHKIVEVGGDDKVGDLLRKQEVSEAKIGVRYGLLLDQAAEIPLAVRRAVECPLKPPGILAHGIEIFGDFTTRGLLPAGLDHMGGKRDRRIRNSRADHKEEGAPVARAGIYDVRSGFGERDLLGSGHRLILSFTMSAARPRV